MTKRGYIRRCDLVRTEDIPLLQLGPGGPFLPSDARGGGGASAGAGDPSTASTASPADGGTGAEPSEPPSSSSTSSSSRRCVLAPVDSGRGNGPAHQSLTLPISIHAKPTDAGRCSTPRCWT